MEKSIRNFKAKRVLEYIQSGAHEGKSLKEIQTFILVMNGAAKWYNKGYLKIGNGYMGFERTPEGRGYWTDYLYGTSHWGRTGFLWTHCTKLPNGKWIVTEPLEGPFRGKETKSLQSNINRARGAEIRRVEALPQCPNCHRPMEKRDRKPPDKAACFTLYAMTHATDCKGRVWFVNDMDAYDDKWSLTSLSKGELAMIESIASKMSPGWDNQRKIVWNEIKKYVIK